MEAKIAACAAVLAAKKLRIAFVESATAGWLCSEFALTEHAGEVLRGGITCYDATLKETLLCVPSEMVKTFTPESQEVTDELARQLVRLIPADIYVAVTGLPRPGGSETPEKPVGTMFVSALIQGRLVPARFQFKGTCEEIIKYTIAAAADLVMKNV